MPIYKLAPVVQRYAWGSPTAIPRWFGWRNPSGVPLAEIWMGTHPRGTSTVPARRGIGLDELLRAEAQECCEGNDRLPYLFKVLAAERALSIQVHPSRAEALDGFAREDAAGIPLSAPERNYKDQNHKPELLVALEPFWAMAGFRDPEETRLLLGPEASELGSDLMAVLGGEPIPGVGQGSPARTATGGDREAARMPSKAGDRERTDLFGDEWRLRRFFSTLLLSSPRKVERAVDRLLENAPSLEEAMNSFTEEIGGQGDTGASEGESRGTEQATARELGIGERPLLLAWVRELHEEYGADPGVLAPLYLKVYRLKRGDGMFLTAGMPHAYLRGLGVELMAASDNVLRCGLTSKHVDRDELLRIVRYRPGGARIYVPEGSVTRYEPPVSEFALEWYAPASSRTADASRGGGPADSLGAGEEGTAPEAYPDSVARDAEVLPSSAAGMVPGELAPGRCGDIVLCTEGRIRVQPAAPQGVSARPAGAHGVTAAQASALETGTKVSDEVMLVPGESAFVPCSVNAYRVVGEGGWFRATAGTRNT